MSASSIGPVHPLLLGYVVAFGIAALACFATVGRARRINDPDTRRGLVGLLLTSGGWASAHVAFLVVPTPQLKTAVYIIGLIVGVSAVGPWLYFCSAYTGRSLHRNRSLRLTAVGVFLAIVAVKVTNPLHHRYFTGELVTTPFRHLAVQTGVLHWLVMGLTYALATVGYFMLLELFVRVSYDTKPLAALVAVTGLPIVFDVVGFASPTFVDITYEPLGVAVFAVGFVYLYVERFQAVGLAGERDDAVLVVDAADRLRDANDAARTLFPDLADRAVIGEPVETVVPTIADARRTETSIVELERAGTRRYYRLTETTFGTEGASLGGLLIVTDITHREQYRQELERQNERLEQFANMVSHDLSNPLQVAAGRLELAREECESDHLDAVATAHARMEELVDDLLMLARQGQPIDETERVTLSVLSEQCWGVIDSGSGTLTIESDLSFVGDVTRLQQLFENLFRNAIEHGGEDVLIRVGALADESGFYVADDGAGIPAEQRAVVFDSGYSTSREGTGFGLAIVREIVDAHGWDVRITQSDDGGARFEVTGVDTA